MRCWIIILLIFLLASCGPSGGKRLATEAAIASVEEAYKARYEYSFSYSGDRALAAIQRARESGDASRKADIRLTIDLDACAQAIHIFTSGRANNLPDHKDPQSESLKKTMKLHDEIFRDAIDRLKQDMR